MPGRHTGGNDYRYGFTGLEADDEVKSEGNSYTTTYRQYDPRIGRWLTRDALSNKFPFYTPYQYAGNKPIVAVDLDGQEDLWIHYKEDEWGCFIKIVEEYELSEFYSKLSSKWLGLELPPTGSVTTVGRQNGTYEISSYTPTATVVAQKPKAKEQKWYEKSWYGSSDNPYEGSRGFHERGGKELFIASITLPISIVTTVASGGGVPALIGGLGLANNIDDLTYDGKTTFVQENIPNGNAVKTTINIANFVTNSTQLINGNFLKLGFGFDAVNTTKSGFDAGFSTVDMLEDNGVLVTKENSEQ